MKIKYLVVVLGMLIPFVVQAQRRPSYTAQQNNNATALMASQYADGVRAAGIQKALDDKRRQWQHDNPWWRDEQWKSLGIKIEGADKQLSPKMTELTLLTQAGQSDSPRYKEVDTFIRNAQAVIVKWKMERISIEAAYRLKQFDKDHVVVVATERSNNPNPPK
jgi:hypothetical protein